MGYRVIVIFNYNVHGHNPMDTEPENAVLTGYVGKTRRKGAIRPGSPVRTPSQSTVASEAERSLANVLTSVGEHYHRSGCNVVD